MSRNKEKDILVKADPEPERTLKRNLKEAKLQQSRDNLAEIFEQEKEMATEPNNNNARRMLGDYTAPTSKFDGRSISIPATGANNFELKPQLVALMQQNCKFHGLPSEDPYQFLTEFLQIYEAVKTNGVDPEVYRLMLFPFAVRDRARTSLDSQPKDSLDSWDKLVTAFLAKFFPPQKLSKLRVDVQTFKQKDGEYLYEAWERYKQMTKRCPFDMFSEWTMIDIFYYGLSEFSKMSLDHSVSGSIHLKKTPAEAQELIDMVVNNQFMYTSERNSVNNEMPQRKGVLEIDALNAILAQNKMLTQQVNMISQSLNRWQNASNNTKEASSEEEAYDSENLAIAEVNYIGEPYGNTYNSSWRNHPNFSWKDQQKPQQGFNNGGRNRLSNIKPYPSSFQQQTENSEQSTSNLANLVSDLSKSTLSFMSETRSSIRNLEAQVGQLSKKITETPPSTLPSNTEENPKRECKAINIVNMAEPREKRENVNPNEEDLMGRLSSKKEFPIEVPRESEAHIETIEIPLNLLLPFMSSEDDSSSEEDEDVTGEQVAQYLEAIMKLNAKLFGNETWEGEPPLLISELDTWVQQTLPQKRQDPGKFVIPCTIGTMIFEKALCDLGSGINLMPLSVMEKLGIIEVQPAMFSLQMTDNLLRQFEAKRQRIVTERKKYEMEAVATNDKEKFERRMDEPESQLEMRATKGQKKSKSKKLDFSHLQSTFNSISKRTNSTSTTLKVQPNIPSQQPENKKRKELLTMPTAEKVKNGVHGGKSTQGLKKSTPTNMEADELTRTLKEIRKRNSNVLTSLSQEQSCPSSTLTINQGQQQNIQLTDEETQTRQDYTTLPSPKLPHKMKVQC
ncbi:uncharacterized protein LOC130941934 [Arachis stenosperma]|uniref:uncharacterized protein LOC130941934 n=1 Tax=Arachis stenosperma TaxID=217475 RepID=UPI0025AD1A47|nr:uncharacterized protein LOC130941934 [Arachis stenosperma]